MEDIFTARKRSLGQGNIFIGVCQEFCSRGGVRVPTQTGKTGKPGKMGRHFPVREKSGNFEQTGKVRENHTKYWKTEGILEKKYLLFFNDI